MVGVYYLIHFTHFVRGTLKIRQDVYTSTNEYTVDQMTSTS